MDRKSNPSTSEEEEDSRYALCLYITGATLLSQQAISRLRTILEEHLAGQYDLRIVDLYEDPAQAESVDIILSPTLLKEHPLPVRKLVGSMADTARVLRGLDLPQPESWDR